MRAEEEAAAAPELYAQLLQAAHGEEREHEGALVVAHAAAEEEPALRPRGEGVRIPALAGAHDVEMREDVERGPLAVIVRAAHGPAVYLRFEAIAAAERRRLVQRAAAFRAEGRARRGRAAHARYRHEPGRIPDELRLVRVHPGAYLLLERHCPQISRV